MFKILLALCVLATATAGHCKFTYEPWTKCSKECGSGVQHRNVKVFAYPTAGGKACPSSTTRVCNSHKCVVPGKDCKVGTVILKHNWQGAGLGKNFCKLYMCKNGRYSQVDKQNKKVCGWHNKKNKNIKKCSNTTCTYKSALVVQHHHAEKKGENHKCVHNTFTNKCNCWCYGRKNVIWRPYTKGGPKRL